jgi:REP element-mobilizing transposase RayT
MRKEQSRAEVKFPRELRDVIGKCIVDYFRKVNYRVLVVAVTKVHVHALVELPDNILKIRDIVGEAKRASSRAVKDAIPGSVWAAGGTYKPIKDTDHQHNAYNYILYDQGPDAWTWSFRDATKRGRFDRPRSTSK